MRRSRSGGASPTTRPPDGGYAAGKEIIDLGSRYYMSYAGLLDQCVSIASNTTIYEQPAAILRDLINLPGFSTRR